MRFRGGERKGGGGKRKGEGLGKEEREKRGKERGGICTIEFRKPGLTVSVVSECIAF